jgi:hypothetical protein
MALTFGVEFYTGHPSAPWGDLADEPHKHIEPRCLPPARLVDPSRMKKADMGRIYMFWFERQKTSRKPLRFKHNLLPSTQAAKIRSNRGVGLQKGKRKEYMEISESEGDEEEQPGRGPEDGSPAVGRNKPEQYLESICEDNIFLACVKRSARLKVGNFSSLESITHTIIGRATFTNIWPLLGDMGILQGLPPLGVLQRIRDGFAWVYADMACHKSLGSFWGIWETNQISGASSPSRNWHGLERPDSCRIHGG